MDDDILEQQVLLEEAWKFLKKFEKVWKINLNKITNTF